MAVKIRYRDVPIEQAWVNLASDVLLLAIEDARQTRDPLRKEKSKQWLRSSAARLFFETLLDGYFDLDEWINADCPKLDKQR